MDNLSSLETIQSFHQASLKRKRVQGFIIDLVSITITTRLITFIYAICANLIFSLVNIHIQDIIIYIASVIYPLTFLSVFIGYFFISYRFGDGQTIGKMVTNTKVIDINTKEHLSALKSLMRSFSHLLCYSSGTILLAIPLLNKRGVGVAEFVSGGHTILTDRPLPSVIYLPGPPILSLTDSDSESKSKSATTTADNISNDSSNEKKAA